MTLNMKLLDEAIAWAEASVKGKQNTEVSWDQGYWFRDNGYEENHDEYLVTNFCNTSCCIAGYIATRNGEKPLIEEEMDYALVVQLPDGTFEDIEVHARSLLGVSAIEAARLFRQENTLAHLRRIADELKEQYA